MEISNDEIPAKTARVSYDNFESEEFEKNMQLNSFLFWNGHTTPFEKLVFVFEIECPLFVRSQIMRTRMASYNELSRRYSKKNIEFFNPDFRLNKNSKDLLSELDKSFIKNEWKEIILPSLTRFYEKLNEKGIAHEVTRQFLPQNLMTKFHMKIDLHNLLNFLELRTSKHAQKETRDVANMMLDILRKELPEIVNMWEIYINMKRFWMEDKYKIFKRKIDESRKFNN